MITEMAVIDTRERKAADMDIMNRAIETTTGGKKDMKRGSIGRVIVIAIEDATVRTIDPAIMIVTGTKIVSGNVIVSVQESEIVTTTKGIENALALALEIRIITSPPETIVGRTTAECLQKSIVDLIVSIPRTTVKITAIRVKPAVATTPMEEMQFGSGRDRGFMSLLRGSIGVEVVSTGRRVAAIEEVLGVLG